MLKISVRYVSNITKEYDNMIKVVVYKEPKAFYRTEYTSVGPKKQRTENYEPSVSSLKRTKMIVQDIVLCNDFELFCTFTFNPEKIDRYNYHQCCSAMRRWFSHQRERSLKYGRELKYLVIPEQHKDGAWHFHALISGYSSTIRDTGLKTVKLRPIYNITSFRLGFTTAVMIDTKEGVSTYITKYISKDFVRSFNRRRFFCSTNLKRPERKINSSVLRTSLPIFRRLVSENDHQFIYHITKTPPFRGDKGGIDKSNPMRNNENTDLMSYNIE